ncbi:hypothetical protein PLCT2_00263 [Planctomycetaceae bacterium]|nr:hypothetical protein PLCT2_00263 [Planctomycetaceae bacterium]
MLFEQAAPAKAAPSASADAETFWTGILGLIRALILGRRLPPDQLRMFLLFAPPVEYLSSEQIAELLGEGCGEAGHELEPELPHGWTQGPSVNDPDSGEAYNADAQILGETLRMMLDKEHPEWRDVCWHDTWCSEGYDFLSYQVLDARGRVTPIACWFEGKLEKLRKREVSTDAAKRIVICNFIERELEFLFENVHDKDERAHLDEEYRGYADNLDDFFQLRGADPAGLYPLLRRCAEHIYDSDQWFLEEWTDPWAYAPMFWAALVALGYTEEAAHMQTKTLFAG